eukprot:gene3659-4175_t
MINFASITFFCILATVSVSAQYAQANIAGTSPDGTSPDGTCTNAEQGLVLTGDDCKFECCIDTVVRSMVHAQSSQMTCTEFDKAASQKVCNVKDYGDYAHGTVVRFNHAGCYVCVDGNLVHYDDVIGRDLHTVTDFTMIRFG